MVDFIGSLGIIAVCMILSAFFSSAESAFLTMQKTSRLTHLINIGDPRALKVAKMLEDPGNLLSVILLGNNLVNILASALATSLLIKLFGNTGVAYAVIIMTILIVIFSEILPKSYAIANAEKLALLVSPIIKPLVFVLAPITWVM